MRNFNFLLHTETGRALYQKVENLPIIDYHNHLSVKDIAENKRFLDVYELWIAPDPYKHRAMRMCGVPEKYITGEAVGQEKFAAWCETLPKLLLNPLSHWSYMELGKIFGWTAACVWYTRATLPIRTALRRWRKQRKKNSGLAII